MRIAVAKAYITLFVKAIFQIPFLHVLIDLVLHNLKKVGTINFHILQIRKLKHKKTSGLFKVSGRSMMGMQVNWLESDPLRRQPQE